MRVPARHSEALTTRVRSRVRDSWSNTPAEAQLTPEERKAGWTETDLKRYRAERDRAAAQSTVGGLELVDGFVVTEFKRPRPPGPNLEGPRMGSKRARARAREGGTHSNPVEINGPEWAADPELKPEERAGGWDPASLATYRRERERAAARRTVGADELVGGLVVTEFERPRPRRPVLEGSGMNSKHYSPWRWSGR